jgi:hypothetical protein
VENAARRDSPGDQRFHRPFDLDALPHATRPEQQIQPVRLDIGQDVGSTNERCAGEAPEVAIATGPIRVAPPEVRLGELLFDLSCLHAPAPLKWIPHRRWVRKKVYFLVAKTVNKVYFFAGCAPIR